MGPSNSAVTNVFRTLIAIVLLLLAAGAAGMADASRHARTRIVEPATTLQDADKAWQQSDLRYMTAAKFLDPNFGNNKPAPLAHA